MSFLRLFNSFSLFGTVLHGPANVGDAIIVSGSPRSGTTWLMNLLSTLPKYKTIFEALHPFWFPQVRQFGFPPRIYLSPEKDNLLLRRYLKEVFGGIVSPKNPLYYLRDLRSACRQISRGRVIAKFINGNRLLPWISERFDIRATYIIIRHPCATISSQLKSGWIGYPKRVESRIKGGNINLLKKIILKEILSIKKFRENLELVEKIKKLDTIEELLAVEWSLDYWIPLTHRDMYEWNLVIYEDLLKNRKNAVQNIFNKIDEPAWTDAYKSSNVPASTSSEKRIVIEKQLIKWKENLTEDQIGRILTVTKWFKLGFYSIKAEPEVNHIAHELP